MSTIDWMGVKQIVLCSSKFHAQSLHPSISDYTLLSALAGLTKATTARRLVGESGICGLGYTKALTGSPKSMAQRRGTYNFRSHMLSRMLRQDGR